MNVFIDKKFLVFCICAAISAYSSLIWLCFMLSFLNEKIFDYVDVSEATYDYIVVGGGTAGIIVADRLAKFNKSSVLLIESGGDCRYSFLNVPVLSPLIFQSKLDWNYKTVSQDYACFSFINNSSSWPRGKVLGGSARLNNIIYLRGHHEDYNSWGSEEWTYDAVLPYFKKTEYHIGRFQNDLTYHSVHGSVPVSDLPWTTPLASSLLDACQELNYSVNDLNGGTQTGFMQTQVNMFEGSRSSLCSSHLQKPDYSYRLKVLTHTTVEKVLLFNGYEATGVQFKRFGNYRQATAKKGVILCAGTIGSPQILMRSGIGPSAHLKDNQIPVVQDLPVGQNLQDHITTGLDLVLLNHTLPLNSLSLSNIMSALQYYLYGTGPWTSPGCEAVGIIHMNISNTHTEPPDLQIMAVPTGLSSDGGAHLKNVMGITQEVWEKYFYPLFGQQTVSLLPVLLHPQSRGQVLLTSPNVDAPPEINPRYLSNSRDVETLYQGILFVKKIIASKSMQTLGARLNTEPLPGCGHLSFDTEDYWKCYIRHLTVTSFHPVGTCKMGPKTDSSSVVDFDLRVHNTNRLYVIDASIMPSLPSSNINAAVMMIAEKGADILKQYWSHERMICKKTDLFKLLSVCSS